MAFVNLSGILTNSIGGIDVGATLKMTHLSTTGDTLSSTITELMIPPDGSYDINLNFGIVRFDYTTDFTQVFLAITTINADTTATTIAELLNSIVEPTSPQLLLFQDILADAQTAETNAAASAAAAAASALLSVPAVTLSEAVTSLTAQAGDYVDIIDRSMSRFIYRSVLVAGQDLFDSLDVIDCTGVVSLHLARVGNNLSLSKYGMGQASGIGRDLMQQLTTNDRDCFVLVQTDSTGNHDFRWSHLTAEFLAREFPAYTVLYYIWNNTNSNYDAAATISTGTSSLTLHWYNGAHSGSTIAYFNGNRRPAVYDNRVFDLIIQNYGHNNLVGNPVASAIRLNNLVYRTIESVSQLIADQPVAEIALTLQNMDISVPAFSAQQVQANSIVARILGCSTIDIRTAFRWKEATGSVGDWLVDDLHPNAIGMQVWTRIVTDSLINPLKQVSGTDNTLATSIKNPIRNGRFIGWDENTSLPFNLSASGNAVVTRETTIKESGDFSISVSSSDASNATVWFEIDEHIKEKAPITAMTFMARVYTPSSNANDLSGKVGLNSSIAGVVSGEYPEVVDGWTWRMIQLQSTQVAGSTAMFGIVHAGDSGDIIYIDRVVMCEGLEPFDSEISSETFPDYYYNQNVGATAGNNITVVGRSVTMDSNITAFPSFYVNAIGLEIGKKYTATYSSTEPSGTVIARAGLNDTGSVVATQPVLGAGTITWTATKTGMCIQVSSSNAMVPFTISNLVIEQS